MKSIKMLLGAIDDKLIVPENRFERAEEIRKASKKDPKVSSIDTKLILSYNKKNGMYLNFEIDKYVKSKENLSKDSNVTKECLLLDIEEAKQKLEKFYAK
jgi:hypothetical protein